MKYPVYSAESGLDEKGFLLHSMVFIKICQNATKSAKKIRFSEEIHFYDISSSFILG